MSYNKLNIGYAPDWCDSGGGGDADEDAEVDYEIPFRLLHTDASRQ